MATKTGISVTSFEQFQLTGKIGFTVKSTAAGIEKILGTSTADVEAIAAANPTIATKDRTRLQYHGLKQKVADEAVGGDTAAAKLDLMRAVVDRLHSGEWFKTRESGESYKREWIILGMCHLHQKMTREQVEAKLATYPNEVVLALADRPDVAAAIAAVKAAKAKPEVAEAAEDLMADFGE